MNADGGLDIWEALNARNRVQDAPLDTHQLATVFRNATGQEPPTRACERAAIIDVVNAHHALIWVGGQLMVLWKDEQDGALPRISRLSDIRAHYKNRQLGKVNPVDAWLESPVRDQYNQLVFQPGAASVGRDFNLWRGWAIDPVPGDCSIFLEHLRSILCSRDESLYQYVLQWLANLVQQPRTKSGTALAMAGGQGIGKGAFWRYIRPIFGVHALQVAGNELLLGRFNDPIAAKLVVFGDEAAWPGDKRGIDKLKSYITEERVSIERKHVPAFEVDHYARFIFATNRVHAAPAEIDDRRFVVLPVDGCRRDDFVYWDALASELDRGGASALLHHLLHEVTININLRRVPATHAHVEQKLMGLDDVGQFWRRMLMQSEHTLRVDGDEDSALTLRFGSVANPATVHEFYLHWCRKARIHYPATLDAFCRASQRYIGELNRREARVEEKRELKLGARARVYELPPIDQVRARFEQAVGAALEWGDGDPNQESL